VLRVRRENIHLVEKLAETETELSTQVCLRNGNKTHTLRYLHRVGKLAETETELLTQVCHRNGNRTIHSEIYPPIGEIIPLRYTRVFHLLEKLYQKRKQNFPLSTVPKDSGHYTQVSRG
jgi:hypothetical protein